MNEDFKFLATTFTLFFVLVAVMGCIIGGAALIETKVRCGPLEDDKSLYAECIGINQ